MPQMTQGGIKRHQKQATMHANLKPAEQMLKVSKVAEQYKLKAVLFYYYGSNIK